MTYVSLAAALDSGGVNPTASDACAMQICDLAEWFRDVDEPSVAPLLATCSRLSTRSWRSGWPTSRSTAGKKQTSATIRLPRGAAYKLRFSLIDVSGQITNYGLGKVTVPRGGQD